MDLSVVRESIQQFASSPVRPVLHTILSQRWSHRKPSRRRLTLKTSLRYSTFSVQCSIFNIRYSQSPLLLRRAHVELMNCGIARCSRIDSTVRQFNTSSMPILPFTPATTDGYKFDLCCPPSTAKHVPITQLAHGDTIKAATLPISSGVPILPDGIVLSILS